MSILKIRACSLLVFITVLVHGCSTPSTEFKQVSFYFSAHPDDWQLFMGELAWHDLQNPSVKTVFILSTAGDASLGLQAAEGATMPYYAARERGYINSIMWAEKGVVDADEDGRSKLPLEDYELETKIILEKPIRYFEGANASAYLLYLPDGFPDGQYRWSLQKLKEGSISEMPAIDSSALYLDWDQLRAVVSNIVKTESNGADHVVINLAERDTTLNPGDHSDHWYTSLLGEEAADKIIEPETQYTKRLFREYYTAELDTNLSEADIQRKRFLFSANAISKELAGYESPWEPHHLSWTFRSYFRELSQ